VTTPGTVRGAKRDVVALASSASVLDAARLMRLRGVGGIAVTEDFEPVGIFTEQDMMRRVVAERRDPATTALGDVMTQPVVTVRPGISLEDCAAIMAAKRIRHLPVVGPDGLIGMVSVRDILAHQVRDRDTTIEHLIDYIRGHPRPQPSVLRGARRTTPGQDRHQAL